MIDTRNKLIIIMTDIIFWKPLNSMKKLLMLLRKLINFILTFFKSLTTSFYYIFLIIYNFYFL